MGWKRDGMGLVSEVRMWFDLGGVWSGMWMGVTEFMEGGWNGYGSGGKDVV